MDEHSTIFYFLNSTDEQVILMEDGTNLTNFCETVFPHEEPSDDVLKKIMAIA